MNILLGVVGSRLKRSKYTINCLVYMDLTNESVNIVDIWEFFNSNLEILGIDKECIISSLGLDSSEDFVYSNNGNSILLYLGDKHIEFNFIIPVFSSNNLDKILNCSWKSSFLNIYSIVPSVPDAILSINLKTFRISLEILDCIVYGSQLGNDKEDAFGYAVHSENGEAFWKELSEKFGIELANGVCIFNNYCFVDARICHTAILDDDVKYCKVYGDYKSSAEIVINPSIEKLDLSGMSFRNGVKLYVSNDIEIYVLRDTLYNCGYKGIKSDDTVPMDLKHLADEIRRFTGVNVEIY